MGVGVVVPAFNEAAKIGSLLDAIPREVAGCSVSVVVVDDGSTDQTREVVVARGFPVVESDSNHGKGHALRLGMERVCEMECAAVVWMDSDGQHDPTCLPSIVEPVLLGGVDMVVGSRYLAKSSTKAPLNRRLVRKATIRVIRAITGLEVTDPFSGYRCFSPNAVDALDLRGDQYESELEALLSVARRGLSVREVSIPRIYGPDTSKMGHHHGDMLGRLMVIGGYARTLAGSLRTPVGSRKTASV